MSRISFIGRIVTDPEFKESARKVPYIRMILVEQIGYGQKAHRQDYHVWAFGERALELQKRSVAKGRLIWVSGSLELVDYTLRDGITKDKKLKVKLQDWDFVNATSWDNSRSKQKSDPNPAESGTAEIVDGERETLPE